MCIFVNMIIHISSVCMLLVWNILACEIKRNIFTLVDIYLLVGQLLYISRTAQFELLNISAASSPVSKSFTKSVNKWHINMTLNI